MDCSFHLCSWFGVKQKTARNKTGNIPSTWILSPYWSSDGYGIQLLALDHSRNLSLHAVIFMQLSVVTSSLASYSQCTVQRCILHMHAQAKCRCTNPTIFITFRKDNLLCTRPTFQCATKLATRPHYAYGEE